MGETTVGVALFSYRKPEMPNEPIHATQVVTWLIMVASPIVAAGFGYVLKGMNDRLKELGGTQQDQGERLAAVESTVHGFDGRFDRLEKQLDRILSAVQKEKT